MTYLDTGCLIKLYYPEADSVMVIAAIQGDVLRCAAAKVLLADEILSTDERQKRLATAIGLSLVTI